MILLTGRIWRSATGSNMKRVNQMQMYRIGNLTRLRNLRDMANSKAEWRNTVSVAQVYLREFIDDPLNLELAPRAVERAKSLMGTINEFKTYCYADELNDNTLPLIELALVQFEASLEDDLAKLPTYLIERTGAYSTDQLIYSADNLFPETMRGTIPKQAILDFRAAGACLAFDLSTACGFHAFRATDAMIRAYYKYFVGAALNGKEPNRDWGTYIRELRKIEPAASRCPNARTLELLDNIRATDRNPIIHPELDLDQDGALSVFLLCQSVITLMAVDIIAVSKHA